MIRWKLLTRWSNEAATERRILFGKDNETKTDIDREGRSVEGRRRCRRVGD